MRRRLFAVLCAASLLLCAGACALWARSHHVADRVSRLHDGERYTVASERGRVVLLRPPPAAGDAKAQAAAAALAAALANDDVFWRCVVWEDSGVSVDWPEPIFDSPADRLEETVPAAARVRPLLAALEDPKRFHAAHLLLARDTPAGRGPTPTATLIRMPPREDGRFRDQFHTDPPAGVVVARGEYAGLPVTLRGHPDGNRGQIMSKDLTYWALAADGDPAQQAAAAEAWHRRLAVPVASAPWWAVAAWFA
ncbi:MAG TPA: hypothetical protein VF796_09795, partial [Humisphaera sp.]